MASISVILAEFYILFDKYASRITELSSLSLTFDDFASLFKKAN